MKRKLPPVHFDPYENCKFCKGKGCIRCKEEKQRSEAKAVREADAAEYLNKHLLFSAHIDNQNEMATLKEVFSASAIQDAFSGSGMADEDVIRAIGGGDFDAGLREVDKVTLMACQLNPDIDEKIVRQQVIEARRRDLVNERAVSQIIDALRGKPGAGPMTQYPPSPHTKTTER